MLINILLYLSLIFVANCNELEDLDVVKCCNYLNEPENLWKCSNASSTSDNENNKISSNIKIAIVTYTTKSILDYASYSLSIITAYAQKHDYLVLHTSPESGHEYDSNDQRWNKVKIVYELMQEYHNTIDYFVYMDSDLIPLSIDWKLESIINQYKSYDMIFSKDSQPLNGLMNSGLFVAKNNQWTHQFLMKWWSTSELREMAIDQHAFSLLWNNERHTITEHIILLQPNILNTNFPAWINQKDDDNILHMAGCSSVFRIDIFKLGLQNLCNAVLNQNSVPKQLGITQQVLYEKESQQPLDRRAIELLKRMKESLPIDNNDNNDNNNDDDNDNDDDTSISSSLPSLEVIQSYRDELRNLFQRGEGATGDSDQHENNPLLIECLHIVYNMLRKRFEVDNPHSTTTTNDSNNSNNNPPPILWEINILEMIFSAGFELALRLHGWKELALLLELEVDIKRLVQYTKFALPEKYRKVLYYKFKLYEFMIGAYQSVSNVHGYENSLKEAISVWKEMHSLDFYGYGRGVDYADPHAEGVSIMIQYAAFKCTNGHYLRGWDVYKEALQLRGLAWTQEKVGQYGVPVAIQRELENLLKDMKLCTDSAGGGFGIDTLIDTYVDEYGLNIINIT